MQVRLSWGLTNVPSGQVSTQRPLERTEPGVHWVHWTSVIEDPPVKLGMLHEEHLDGHATRRLSIKHSRNAEGKRLTITDTLEVISHQAIRTRAHAVGIRRHALSIRHEQTPSTSQTVTAVWTRAGIALPSTIRTRSSIRKSRGRTNRSSTRRLLDRLTLGAVIRILLKTRLASRALRRRVRTFIAPQLTSRTRARRR